MPGVQGAWTAASLALEPQGDADTPALLRPVLAEGRVRFVGEAVAVIAADTLGAALDAADAVVVDIEPLPAVVGPVEATSPDAALLFPEHGSNIVGGRHHDLSLGFFEDADVVARVRMSHHRVAPVPMEPNAFAVEPTPDGGWNVWASTQSVFGVREAVAKVLGAEPSAVRVRAPWVGGGFGAKGGVYPEQLVVAAVSARLGRPVVWVETRTENLLAMTHGRAQIHEVEIGATRDGRFTGLRVLGWADVGAYPGRGMFIPMVTRRMSAGVYRFPKIDFSAVTVVTSTTPTGPYRGAGRPEAAALVERAVDALADELDIDPVELRRRNFPDPSEFPFTTATGATYDSGDYAGSLDAALALAGYDELRADQARRRQDPDARLLGIGVATYVEISGGGQEMGSVRVLTDGTVEVVTGSVANGQGHQTTWAQIAASVLGVPLEAVRVVSSDTGLVDHGVGSFGSRSLQLGGSAVHEAAHVVVDQARRLAADVLEAAPDDIVVTNGGMSVAGVPASGRSWAELASVAESRAEPLAHSLDFGRGGSFPFGCHVAVVEIDRETGKVALRDMVAVDDCGVVINPLLAEGQVHGGLAQGIAQALLEEVRYDPDGNPVTSNLADYAFITAAELPSFERIPMETPTPVNELGAKGIGESGTIGSTPAVHNAVLDALVPFGVKHLDMPCTSEKVWRAINGLSAPEPDFSPPAAAGLGSVATATGDEDIPAL